MGMAVGTTIRAGKAGKVEEAITIMAAVRAVPAKGPDQDRTVAAAVVEPVGAALVPVGAALVPVETCCSVINLTMLVGARILPVPVPLALERTSTTSATPLLPKGYRVNSLIPGSIITNSCCQDGNG